MTVAQAIDWLRAEWACGDALSWLQEFEDVEDGLQAAWDSCQRGEWSAWLLGHLAHHSLPWSDERKPLVLLAIELERVGLDWERNSPELETWATEGGAVPRYSNVTNARVAAAGSSHLDCVMASAAGLDEDTHAWLAAEIVRKHYPRCPALPVSP